MSDNKQNDSAITMLVSGATNVMKGGIELINNFMNKYCSTTYIIATCCTFLVRYTLDCITNGQIEFKSTTNPDLVMKVIDNTLYRGVIMRVFKSVLWPITTPNSLIKSYAYKMADPHVDYDDKVALNVAVALLGLIGGFSALISC